jgi:hypothetical protein
MPPINLNENVRALDGPRLRVLQVIPPAVAAAVLIACAAAVGLHATRAADAPAATYDDLTLISLLSLVHLVLAATAWGLAFLLYHRLLVRPSDTTPTVDGCLASIRTATIVRLSILEAPALFGALICIIASQRGVLDAEPFYWLNLASAAGLLAAVVLTFPTRDRITVLLTGMLGGRT